MVNGQIILMLWIDTELLTFMALIYEWRFAEKVKQKWGERKEESIEAQTGRFRFRYEVVYYSGGRVYDDAAVVSP